MTNRTGCPITNWTPLFDHIRKTIGANAELSIDLSGKYPEIKCDNLVAKSGIFAAVISEVEVSIFGFGQSSTTDQYWMSINLAYKSKSGGTNGMKICDAWYDMDEDKWEFANAGERYKS